MGHSISRRRFLTGAIAGCSVLALAACGVLPGVGGGAGGKITFLAQSGQTSEDRYKPVIDIYQKNGKGQVDVIWGGASSAEIQQKLLTMIAGGTAPDVYWTHTYINGGLSKRNVPLDLNPMIQGDSSFKTADYYTAALQDFANGGKQYALPRETTSTILLYNKAMFDKAGVGLPSADWSWEDLHKAAIALTKGDGATKQYGLAGFQQKGYAYYAFIRVWHEGGDVLNQERTQYTLDQEPGVAAIQWLADLITKDKVHASSVDLGGLGADQVFNTGRIAMMPSISVYSSYQKTDFEWDIQHLPKSAQGKQITRNASAGHSIVAASKAKDAAWSFTSYLASKDVFSAMAKLGLLIPSHKAVAEEIIGQTTGKPKNVKIGLDALGYARPEPVAGDWIGVHQEISTALEGVFGPQPKPVKDSLSAIAGRVNDLIKKEPQA
ncbi:MAG TPA: sugar ABC transporter substrate-binding protein [Chloroflexota bacterium]|nr:sugar ABC transporter substrate-binding protein [Chloroflexota bacterium]